MQCVLYVELHFFQYIVLIVLAAKFYLRSIDISVENKEYVLNSLAIYCTVCPGSSDPFYIVSYYLKWVTTSWTHSLSEKSLPFVFSKYTMQIRQDFMDSMRFGMLDVEPAKSFARDFLVFMCESLCFLCACVNFRVISYCSLWKIA